MLRPAFALLLALVISQNDSAIANEKTDVAERRERRAETSSGEDVRGTGSGTPQAHEADEPKPARRNVLPIR